jgi:hypothetical protein
MDFFKELREIRLRQPHPAILTVNSINSDY